MPAVLLISQRLNVRMKYKFYNKKLFTTFFSLLLFFAVFNISVDPYDIFKTPLINKFNKIKPEAGRNQRITKIISFKLEKRPVDTVFLGSSRVNSTISEDYYGKITGGKIAKNLGMNALSHDETVKMAKNLVKIHPEIKTIYVGLDFFRFLEKNKDNKRAVSFSNNKNLTISEFNPVVLSFNTIISSVITVIKNIKYNGNAETSQPVDLTPLFISKLGYYGGNYFNAVLSENEILKLKEFKCDMEKNGYKVKFYINPTHAMDMSLINKLGFLPVFERWKTLLAENFDYVDFDWVNSLTSEKVDANTKYFAEMSHATSAFGTVILDCLILHKNNYGVYTDKNNIKKNLSEQRKALFHWEAENPMWEAEIRKVIDNAV